MRHLATFLLLLMTLPALPHAQWSTAQGGNSRRDGRASTLGPAGPALAWKNTENTQYSAPPLIGDGRVVYSRTFDSLSPAGSVIEAADLATGQLLWSTSLPGGLSPFNLPIAMRDGQVYARRAQPGLANEILYALDATTGALLWEAEDVVQHHLHSSPSFLSNGDLLVNGEYVPGAGWRLLRIDHQTGATVWNRPPPEGTNPPAAGGAVYMDRFYLVHELPGAYEIERLDPSTGMRMYGSALETVPPTRGATSNNLLIAEDGTLFWPYSGDTVEEDAVLISLTDTGTALLENWRVPMAELWTSSLAIAPDGTVLAYSRANELVRLDPATGAVVDRSARLPVEIHRVNTTVDREGRVFVVAEGLGPTSIQLLAFDPELRLQWTLLLGLPPAAGASISDGHLAVSTARDVLRVYEFDAFRHAPDDCVSSAAVSYRNGTNLNRACFFPTELPRLGRPWTAEIFAGVHPTPNLYGLIVRAGSGSLISPFGELLVDPGSQRLFTTVQASNGGIDVLRFDLPDDATLCGRQATAQVFLVGPPQAMLCNALDLVLGP